MPPRELIDLEPGEEILLVARASFRGAAAVSTRATFALGSARMRRRAYDQWHDAAFSSGVGPTPADMVIAATDRRVLLGKPTFWGGTPAAFWSEIEYRYIAQIVAMRHGLVTGVAFGLASGDVVEVEAIRGAKLRRFVDIVEDHLPRH